MEILHERTIALAGVLQACQQVQSLAREGESNQLVFDSCLKSILVLDALNTLSVYGGLDGVQRGLGLIANGILNSASVENAEICRYAITILQLQNQLYKDSSKFGAFAQDVERLSGVDEDELIQSCSDVYQKYVSEMRPQVLVQGEQHYLERATVPPSIRTMLLAALRSGVLWQQKSGSRFRIVWERTRMQNAAKYLLAMR